MEVGEATEDDVESVQRVARRAWTAAYEDIVGQEEIDACMREWYSREFLEERLDAPDLGYFVAVADEEVVGYASAGPRKGDGEGQLFTIYVDPTTGERASARNCWRRQPTISQCSGWNGCA